MQGLTADSGASSESSAKGWCGRRVAVDLGRPETKTTPPRTKRSSRQWPDLGLERLRGGYRARGSRREGGTDAGAHGGFGGVVGELGEGLVRPEGRRRSQAAEDEDDAAEDEVELARVAWLGEEGEGVVAELWSVFGRCGSGRGHGGCGRWRRPVRPRERERRGRGNGHGGERERCGAARGVARVFQARRGRSRRWPDAWPRAPSACPCPPGTRKGTTGTASWLGRPAGPLGQAGCTVPGRR